LFSPFNPFLVFFCVLIASQKAQIPGRLKQKALFPDPPDFPRMIRQFRAVYDVFYQDAMFDTMAICAKNALNPRYFRAFSYI